MSPRDALAIEIHRPRRLNVDEQVAVIAAVLLVALLAALLLWGYTHPTPTVESCYSASKARP